MVHSDANIETLFWKLELLVKFWKQGRTLIGAF